MEGPTGGADESHTLSPSHPLLLCRARALPWARQRSVRLIPASQNCVCLDAFALQGEGGRTTGGELIVPAKLHHGVGKNTYGTQKFKSLKPVLCYYEGLAVNLNHSRSLQKRPPLLSP